MVIVFLEHYITCAFLNQLRILFLLNFPHHNQRTNKKNMYYNQCNVLPGYNSWMVMICMSYWIVLVEIKALMVGGGGSNYSCFDVKMHSSSHWELSWRIHLWNCITVVASIQWCIQFFFVAAKCFTKCKGQCQLDNNWIQNS